MAKRRINKGDYKPRPVASIRQIVEDAARDCPDRDAYQFRVGNTDEIEHITFAEFKRHTDNLGAFLTSIGKGNAHIACTGENRYEWITAFLTVMESAGVFVPIDKELPAADKLNLVNDSDSTVLFFSKKFEKFVRENMDQMPNVEYFIGFDIAEDEGKILSYNRCMAIGETLDKTEFQSLQSDPDEMKLLVYTSGTTGIAKGVMLTEHNICSEMYYGFQRTQMYARSVNMLPLHHTYAGNIEIIGSIYYHTTVCINKNMKTIVKDLQLFKPEHIIIVPAVAEFMYSSILKNIKAQGKQKSFEGAIKLSETMRKVGVDLRPTLFKSVRDVFGGELIKIVCGGAAIRPEIGKFFDTIGIYLTGGYGITECSPLVSANDEHAITYDTVGKRLPCLEWRIDEPNEEGIGEVCIKGDTVMLGYYKNPEATAEAIVDGWFFTGDYGYINDNDELVITGRKKNVIVLNNGKNIYPEEIEKYIQNLDYIEEVVVRSYVNDNGDETSLLAEVYLGDVTKEEREILVDITYQLKELPKYKQVTVVKVRPEPFPKTSTKKIRRNAI